MRECNFESRLLKTIKNNYCGECQEYYSLSKSECPSCSKSKKHNDKLKQKYKSFSTDKIVSLYDLAKSEKNINEKKFQKYLDIDLVYSWRRKEII